jgi:hypothetical protein
MEKKVAITALIVALIAAFAVSCGYTLEGRGSLLPPHILRVGIPTLDNNTTMPSLGEIVTSEIYSEFLSRGNFRLISSDAGVDALLEGEIVSYSLVPRAIDEEGVATSFLVSITANVTFRDMVKDVILWEQENYRFQREYQLSDIGGDFVTQELESVRLAAKDFANSLVASILTGF